MNDRLQFLFNRYIVEEITPEEKSELSGLIRMANNQEVSALLKEEWEKTGEGISVLSSSEAESILQQIIGTKPPEVNRIHLFQQTWFRVAAAVLFMVGVFTIYKLAGTKNIAKQEMAHAETIKQDIAPGGNKATLTLANGSTIVLNNVQNGTITQQGNTKILKLANGQLAYNSLNEKPTEVLYNTITTPRGGQYQLTLSDGTKVWLNAASSLRYPTSFSGKERRVELTGEGYFEVAHNAAMPFQVQVSDIDVQVLGTHFNINAYEDEGLIKTTLLQGSVKVSKGNSTILIVPDEQARVNNTSGELTVKKNVDLDEVVAWKNGLFQFDKADIKTIMLQISRWYNVNVFYQGNIPKREFDGKIQRDLNLLQVLDLLGKNKVHFKIEGRSLVVMP